MGAHKQLKTLLPTLRGRSGNDGSYNNLFNFKSIVTQFYTQSVPSDRYALSRTRALWCHVPSHASCMSQTHTATCMELRIGFLSRPPPFPTISPTQTRLSLLPLFISPPHSKEESPSLSSFLCHGKLELTSAQERFPEPTHDPLRIPTPSPPSPHAGEGYHVLPPVLRPQGYHVFPLLSPGPEHRPPPHCWTCPSCHRRRLQHFHEGGFTS